MTTNSDRERRAQWSARVVKRDEHGSLQERVESVRYWRGRAPEERFTAMAELIDLHLAVRAENHGEQLSPRLDRSVVRVQRSRR
jgi:hypothetical protein